jgi:hypothetical protein
MTEDTGGESDGDASRALPVGKVAIDKAWFAGWKLLFTQLHRIVPQIWVPAVILVFIELGGWQTRVIRSGDVPGVAGEVAIEVVLYALIAVGAYDIAFGRFDRWTIARLAVGGAELRYLLAKLVFWAVLAGLLYGGVYFGARILVFLRLRDILVYPNPSLTDAQWIKQIGVGGWTAICAPVAFAALVFAWFGTRFSLSFPAACSGDGLSPLAATRLSGRNSWHLTGLFLLLAFSLVVLFGIISSVIGLPDIYKAVQQSSASSATSMFGNSGLSAPGVLQKNAKLIVALSQVSFGTIWQIVFAGALAKAYRAVKPAA